MTKGRPSWRGPRWFLAHGTGHRPESSKPGARLKTQAILGTMAALAFLLAARGPAMAGSVLFDASKREMAGNADWVVDADLFDLSLPAYPCTGSTNESNPQRFPSPPQAGITAATPESYWKGGVSAWAVDLVKAGHTVETLPPGGAITFGDAGNPQDLSHYQLFVVVEPQRPFTAGEKAAILAYAAAGGGLFMVADHETSDRDCDGWDSPHVWNDLTGAVSASSTGVFGIWFRVDGSSAKPSEDWFDDPTDANASTDPADPIVHGPFGSGAGGLGLFGATSMEIRTADNPTVVARIWRSGQPHDEHRVTFATASYGGGRVAAIGDSSPADDSTGDGGDTLYPGWDRASGGVANREIHLNACAWLLNAAPDTEPPVITAGPAATAGDCSATVTWTTDEAAGSRVDYGPDTTYGASALAPGLTLGHAVTVGPLVPATEYRYRVSSSDAAGNGPAESADAAFTTGPPSAPAITTGPSALASGQGAVIRWSTDEAATSQVEYGTTTAYGQSASAPGSAVAHEVVLGGLTPTTAYHYRAVSTDMCGNGPVYSADGTFNTAPASIDVSGWTIVQSNSSQTFTLPPGASIPSGGYLVLGRDASRSEFEAFFPAMPAATVYFDSNASGSCADGCLPQINGGETYALDDASSVRRDGPTIAVASHNAYGRTAPGAPAGAPSSWSTAPQGSAGPGQGAGSPSGAGVVINEMADASDYRKEFIELFYDAGAAPADTTPPARITDVAATPVSATSVRVSWTAVGDDGTAGTAASYDVRRSAHRILNEADFAAATTVAGEPAPHAAGFAEQLLVGGLEADTPYFFALKVLDEAANPSSLSTCASAVTAPPGGSPQADHLVISQVQTNGDGAPPADDEFVEIYNPTASPIGLGGLSLQYKSATGTTHLAFALPAVSLAPRSYYLVARSAYNGSPPADAVQPSFLMAAAGGHVFLVNGAAALPSASCSTSPAIIDKLAYGTGNCPEGSPSAAPAANGSVVRRPGGTAGSGQDTDDNASDFQAGPVSSPHNAQSPPATPPGALGNVRDTLFLTQGASGTTLEWGRAAGASAYRVYRGAAPGFLGGGPAPWMVVEEPRILDGAAPAPIFFYVVRATDGVTESTDE